jgi:hypothetical protein
VSWNEPQSERTEHRLKALLGAQCPSPLRLGEWSMNLLSPAETSAVRVHVQECPACQAELHTLEEFSAAPDGEAEAEEAPGLVARTREIVLQWLSPVQQPGVALAGVRGSASRAQTFTAAHLWLAVTVQDGDNGRRNLLALVTREDGYPLENGTAWLSQEHRLFTGGRVDPRGNLVISGLEPGVYDLGIQCDGTRVWVRGVSV